MWESEYIYLENIVQSKHFGIPLSQETGAHPGAQRLRVTGGASHCPVFAVRGVHFSDSLR